MKQLVLILFFGTAAFAVDNVFMSNMTDDKQNETTIMQAGPLPQTFEVAFSDNESAYNNSIYIEQAGNNQNVSIHTSGSENRIQSYQAGDQNHASIQMAGSGSKAINPGELHLESAVLVKQDGNDNSAEIEIKSGNGNGAAIYQLGDKSIASIMQKEGGQNRAWIEQRDQDRAMISQSGNANTALVIQN